MTPQHRRECQTGMADLPVPEVTSSSASASGAGSGTPRTGSAAAPKPAQAVVPPKKLKSSRIPQSSVPPQAVPSVLPLDPAACSIGAGVAAGVVSMGGAIGGTPAAAVAAIAVVVLAALVFALPQHKAGKSLMARFRYQEGIHVALNNPLYADLFPTDVPVECRPPCLMHVVS